MKLAIDGRVAVSLLQLLCGRFCISVLVLFAAISTLIAVDDSDMSTKIDAAIEGGSGHSFDMSSYDLTMSYAAGGIEVFDAIVAVEGSLIHRDGSTAYSRFGAFWGFGLGWRYQLVDEASIEVDIHSALAHYRLGVSYRLSRSFHCELGVRADAGVALVSSEGFVSDQALEPVFSVGTSFDLCYARSGVLARVGLGYEAQAQRYELSESGSIGCY